MDPLSLFVGFTVWFWVWVAFVGLILSICVAWEAPGWATVTFLAACGLSDWALGTHIYASVMQNPLVMLEIFAVYILIGVIWSMPKWFFHVREIREDYLYDVNRFLWSRDREQNNQIPEDLVADWLRSPEFRRWDGEIPPLASKNKSRITLWMMYWPISMVWTLIDEPVRRTFNFVYEQIQGVYTRISEHAFRDLPPVPSSRPGVTTPPERNRRWFRL